MKKIDIDTSKYFEDFDALSEKDQICATGIVTLFEKLFQGEIETKAIFPEIKADLDECLEKHFSSREKSVFVKRYGFEGKIYSAKEIANVDGISESYVNMILKRGLKYFGIPLRKNFAKESYQRSQEWFEEQTRLPDAEDVRKALKKMEENGRNLSETPIEIFKFPHVISSRLSFYGISNLQNLYTEIDMLQLRINKQYFNIVADIVTYFEG